MTATQTGNLPIDDPLPESEVASWDHDCGLLVVGLGAAGAAVAISAAEQGVEVLAVDRIGAGGATARSGGVVYAGGGTAQQKAAGYDDSPEAMYRYLKLEVGDAVSDATLRRFCEDSRAQLEWLESLGARFDSELPPPKTSYPPDGCYLYYSGNEGIKPFVDAAPAAPRGHRTVCSGLSGKRLFSYLRARVDALAVPVLEPCSARRLITDASGAVVGAELWQLAPDSPAARRYRRLIQRSEWQLMVNEAWGMRTRAKALKIELAHARPLRVRARQGVVLTTGGFVMNHDMLSAHAPKFSRNLKLGTTGCEGSGIRLGQSAGGVTDRMHKISAWRFINPPSAWAGGLVVNQGGQRYCNEASYGARLGVAMCEDQDGRSWLIIDRRQRRAAFRDALFGKLWSFQHIPAILLMLFAPRGRTAAALAAKLGMPAEVLEATIAENNRAAAAGEPDAFGKTAPTQSPLDTPPYYAIDVSVDNRQFPCPAITLGGLRVDESNGLVLDQDGHTIAGLYAAGRAAVGVASNGYVSGLSIADCLWSGRRVGHAVATQNRAAAA